MRDPARDGSTAEPPAGCAWLAGADWYKRLQAWGLHTCGATYETAIRRYKLELLRPLNGVVAEIGAGAGANLPYYGKAVRWVGIEPNRHALAYLRQEAERRGVSAEVVQGVAERLPLRSASVDAVVGTLVLCTVFDQRRALAEVHRVLRPGGRFVFIEHVAARRASLLRGVQRAVRPLWRVLGDGCEPDRETWKRIREAFSATETIHFRVPFPLVGPHIAGWAVK